MKSDTDIVVENSRMIEKLLIKKFKGKGDGLVKILKSIEKEKISRSLDFVIRQIAHSRNRVVHDGGKLRDKSRFLKMVEAAKTDLNLIDAIQNASAIKSPEQDTKRSRRINKVNVARMKSPEDLDPYVVDVERGGTFGSERYERYESAQQFSR